MDALDTELLAEAVDRLPEPERTLVNGLFYERASHREMARRLGVQLHDVQRIRRSAMSQLRTLIEGAE